MSKNGEYRISVIVPNFNNAEYLEECISSILDQSYENFEIIITDDCSTDNSRQIIEKFADANTDIKPLFHDENIGVSANRHEAILTAEGDFITTIDSDDVYYDKKKLETELKLILWYEEKGKEIISYSKTALLNSKGQFLRMRADENFVKSGRLLRCMLTRNCDIPVNFLFRKEQYIESDGYDQGLELYEDWDLKLRLAAKYEFYCTGITGTGVRLHREGLSSANPEKHINLLNKVFEKNIDLVPPEDQNKIRNNFLKNLNEIHREIERISSESPMKKSLRKIIEDNPKIFKFINSLK